MKLLSVASIETPVWKAHIADENDMALCGKKSIHRQILIPGTVQEPNCIRCCELWNTKHTDEPVKVPARKKRVVLDVSVNIVAPVSVEAV